MKSFLITGVSLRSRGGVAMVVEAINLVGKSNNYKLISYYPEIDKSVVDEYNLPLKVVIAKPSIKTNKLAYKIEAIKMMIDVLFMGLLKVSQFSQELQSVDEVLQIHGISFSKHFGLNNALTIFLEVLISKFAGKKFTALPHSCGPNTNKIQLFIAKKSLNMMSKVMPRGNKSIEFIKKIAPNSNYEFVPDLAFNYKNPEKIEIENHLEKFKINIEKKWIGIIPNILFLKWGYKETITYYSQIIEYYSQKGYSFIFIAHEYDSEDIDDRDFNKELLKKLKNINYFYTDKQLSAQEIKSLISFCEFTICSRFHGMISSLKMNITPFVIGWADKYFEIMELFELENNVVDYKCFNFDNFISNINNSNLLENSKKIEETNLEMQKILKNVFESNLY